MSYRDLEEEILQTLARQPHTTKDEMYFILSEAIRQKMTHILKQGASQAEFEYWKAVYMDRSKLFNRLLKLNYKQLKEGATAT